ncbi:protein SSUH2 homolog [Engystomops pustulosus]|uniref:protein SSUH2 homolog n=1 Tax=Engystomops pustulosus TaxID=76066 RepID=UPI003AFB5863
MHFTNPPVVSSSPDPVSMVVNSSRTTSEFVDVDLSTPKMSRVALVPPSMASVSPPTPEGCSAPPMTSLNCSTEQLYPNPAVRTGSDTAAASRCRPPVDVQVSVVQKSGGAPVIPEGKKCAPPAHGQSPVSGSSHTDPRALLITEAMAKQAIEEYGNSKCCYGGAPTREMAMEELQPLNTYKYLLETFTESRICEWVTEQYTGQHVDCRNVASTLKPWEVPVAVPDMFMDGIQKMKVPHTSSVKTCSHCKGMGKNMCRKCHGTGRIQCMWCNGTGRRMQMEMCQQCYGSGTECCRMCDHSTAQNCAPCGGRGQVLTYIQLTITWKNNKYQFISAHKSEFSSDLFKTVHGERIYTDEQLTVSPLVDFPDSSIIWASQNALEQHRTQFSSSCRVIRQRQSVELLPLTRVRYTWRGEQRQYYVYGKENKVYVQSNPQKCCCTIM